MNFPQYEEFENFIKRKNLIAGFLKMREINVGGSSYNFCVTTTKGQYLLKLIKKEAEYIRLQSIFNQFKFNSLKLKENFWQGYHLLTMPFYEGHKLRYKDCSDENLSRLWEAYTDFLKKAERLDSQIVHSKYDRQKNLAKLEDELENCTGVFGFIFRKYKAIFKNCLQEKVKNLDVIHGDFTENNILINRHHELHIIDFDFIRYGNIAEDLCCLILQLSGFRGLYGNIWRFKRLYHFFQTMRPLKKDDWLYGVRLFYLEIMRRRLNAHSKTLHSFRKKICLLLILFGYFRIKRFLQKSIT